jgi:arginine:ornithine antiporter/lysine permease
MLQPDLARLPPPSMAGVMAHVVGPWGGVFISVGLLISVLGNYLSWSLLAAEVVHAAGKDGVMPNALARENAAGAPAAALWITNITIQAFLIISWFAEEGFTMALKMTGVMTLAPYLLVAAYGVRLSWTGETYDGDPKGRRRDLARAVLATLYACLMLWAGGMKFMLLSALLYLPATVLFVLAMREKRARIFAPRELLLLALIVIGASVGLDGLITGAIVI